jgi:dihydrolipoamide dehydrogenase
VVRELKVKLGDKVAEGSVIVLDSGCADLPAAAATAAPPAPARSSSAGQAAAAPKAAAPAAAPAYHRARPTSTCDLLVLGAGPGGYSAAFRAADLGPEGGAGRALCRSAACA